MVLLKGAQPTTPPPPGLMEAIMQLGEEATKSGALLDTAGLAPSAAGARVELTAGQVTVTDGPFAESKELISYALYDVRNKDEAVEWAARFIRIHQELLEGWEGTADVVKVMGPEDFAPPA
jgi:hypothetical protein